MPTLEETMALLAKAAYCKVRPTLLNPNPTTVDSMNGAEDALNSWIVGNVDWEVIDFVNDTNSGMQAVAYKNGNQIAGRSGNA